VAAKSKWFRIPRGGHGCLSLANVVYCVNIGLSDVPIPLPEGALSRECVTSVIKYNNNSLSRHKWNGLKKIRISAPDNKKSNKKPGRIYLGYVVWRISV